MEEEKKEVLNVRFYRNSIDDFCNQAENTVDDYQKELCYSIAQRYKTGAEESEEKLLEIRKELK